MTRPILPAVVLAALAFALAAFAADPPPPAETKKAEELARTVLKDLRQHADPVPGVKWADVNLRVTDRIGTDDFAAAAGWEEWADGTRTPYLTLTRRYVAFLGADRDVMALVLAYQLAGLAPGPVKPGSPLKAALDLPRREAEATRLAARLVLKSGYSLRKALTALVRDKSPLSDELRSAWVDRLRRLDRLLDKDDEALWRLMPAFQTGTMFLATGNYDAAALCFERVTKEFPAGPEAWTHLGIAHLLDNSARVDPDDLRRSGFGHFLGIGSSPPPTVVTRPVDRSWFRAVGALRESDRLKPGQALVLANLGLAYLLHPEGKKEGLTEATKYLTAALKALKDAKAPDTGLEAALLVNLGVCLLADGKPAEARKRFDEATALSLKLPAGPKSQVERAVSFNAALVLATEGKHAEAAKRFKQYLDNAPPSDVWREVAYDHYAKACAALNTKPFPRIALRKPHGKLRPQVVRLPSGRKVELGDDTDEALNKLGKPFEITRAVHGTNLRKLRFDQHGIDLIADDEVLLVAVVTAKGPRIPLRLRWIDGKPLGEVRVGMTRKEVESQRGGADYTIQPFTPNADRVARYPALGIAVVYDRSGPEGVVVSILVGVPAGT